MIIHQGSENDLFWGKFFSKNQKPATNELYANVAEWNHLLIDVSIFLSLNLNKYSLRRLILWREHQWLHRWRITEISFRKSRRWSLVSTSIQTQMSQQQFLTLRILKRRPFLFSALELRLEFQVTSMTRTRSSFGEVVFLRKKKMRFSLQTNLSLVL